MLFTTPDGPPTMMSSPLPVLTTASSSRSFLREIGQELPPLPIVINSTKTASHLLLEHRSAGQELLPPARPAVTTSSCTTAAPQTSIRSMSTVRNCPLHAPA